MNKIIKLYQDNASIPKKQLKDILKHDLWWDSKTCLKYGLVDEIWEKIGQFVFAICFQVSKHMFVCK